MLDKMNGPRGMLQNSPKLQVDSICPIEFLPPICDILEPLNFDVERAISCVIHSGKCMQSSSDMPIESLLPKNNPPKMMTTRICL